MMVNFINVRWENAHTIPIVYVFQAKQPDNNFSSIQSFEFYSKFAMNLMGRFFSSVHGGVYMWTNRWVVCAKFETRGIKWDSLRRRGDGG